MADIRRLDGTPIDVAKPARDERVGSMLAEVSAENDAGRISAIIIVHVTPEGTQAANWVLPLEDFGFPWGLALRGALVHAQYVLDKATIALPEKQEPVA